MYRVNICFLTTVYRYLKILLFIPSKCTRYVKYIYLSPITSYMFRCLFHHLQGDHSLLAQKLYTFCNVTVKCTVQYTIRISSYCILKNLKTLVKILNCSTLISVGSCNLLCMLAIYVFTVSSCIWVRTNVEFLRGLPFLLLCCSSLYLGVLAVLA